MEKKNLQKEKLLNAVDYLLKNEGYKSLKLNKIAKQAGVDKNVIYRQFGDLDTLIETYLFAHDYWTNTVKKVKDAVVDGSTPKINDEQLVNFFLERQFKTLFNDEVLQEISLWSISEKNPLMTQLMEDREKVGSEIFKLIDEDFKNPKINFRAVSYITVAAINFLVLYTKCHSTKFCEIDLNTDEGQQEIIQAIKLINSWAFSVLTGESTLEKTE